MSNFYVWLILGVVFSITEIFTATFGALIVGIGAFVAAFLSFINLGASYQFIAFSLSALLAAYVMVKVLKAKNKAFRKTFIDDIINNTCCVLEDIKKDGSGKVKINGEVWIAVSKDGTYIPKGETVKIIKIEGTKLIVEKEESDG
jgi:membrane protein implicated in regulation of membrane protease activity